MESHFLVSAENTNLKLAVHQHKLELQERNLVLAKAKAAIEALKKETERLREVEADALRGSSDIGRAVKEATAKKGMPPTSKSLLSFHNYCSHSRRNNYLQQLTHQRKWLHL